MKLPYKAVLNAVRYCHSDYWHSLSNEERDYVSGAISQIFIEGGVSVDTCYPSHVLIARTKAAYCSDVQAAIDELEMQHA